MFNVTRPDIEIENLKLERKYNTEEVLNKLREIFFDKCYLCEKKYITDVQIEHFIPHKGDPKKKFDWNNLYYACSTCNNTKLTDNDLLDCCNPDHDVFRAIKMLPPRTPSPRAEIIIEPMDNRIETLNTVELLKKIYIEAPTANKAIAIENKKKEVFEACNHLLEPIKEYANRKTPPNKKVELLTQMQTLMSKEQEFSAFLRWVVLNDGYLLQELEPYMD